MQLIVALVCTILPCKSRVEISFKGVGCDTPSVTVADTVSLQYPHHVPIVVMQYKHCLSLGIQTQTSLVYLPNQVKSHLCWMFKILHTSIII
jgi:hypothetical protein